MDLMGVKKHAKSALFISNKLSLVIIDHCNLIKLCSMFSESLIYITSTLQSAELRTG